MRAYKPILLLLALVGLSVAREAPGPEAGLSDIPSQDEALQEQAGPTSEEWLDILAPVLAVALDED